ncbi:hypothetical protein JCM10908_001207 [Rhodotorula pacifica]|uniref:uncharacterized protein n=1 Tax=Rhodotorula pacifica TaxID=1495444 RepID=UPI0031747E11
MTEATSSTSTLSSVDKVDADITTEVVHAASIGLEGDDDAQPTIPAAGVSSSSATQLESRRRIRLEPSETSKNVKCVVAYALGSLFTFIPKLSDWLGNPWDVDGPVRNAHLVATIAVYFSPGRTVGAMIETDLYLAMGAIYALFLMAGSMGTAIALQAIGQIGVAHVIIPILWLGGGYALLAFAKITVNKPSFSTACSLVGLACSPIITKEGAFHIGRLETDSIERIVVITLIGSCISNLVCFVLWPQKATDKLARQTAQAIEAISGVFDATCSCFLTSGAGAVPSVTRTTALEKLQGSLASMKSTLVHAKCEMFLPLNRDHSDTLEHVLLSLGRLAQGLSGLQSCCGEMCDEASEDERVLRKIKESLRHLQMDAAGVLRICSQAIGVKNDGSQVSLATSLNHALSNVGQSLATFRQAHPEALAEVYRSTLTPANEERLFRIYQFCYNVEAWADELIAFCSTFRDLLVEARPSRAWDIRHFSISLRQLAQRVAMKVAAITSTPVKVFPIIQDAALTPHLLDPETAPRSALARFKLRLWRFGHALSGPDARFAIKTGVGAAVLATAAFDAKLRPLWLAWRGEWALISYMVIMAPSLGATNFLAASRIVGTAVGAGTALATFKLFSRLPVVLVLVGAALSAPCFRLAITQPKYATSTRFTLLAYNLTCLYAFNLREADVPIESLAFRRFVAVSVGVLWALIVNGYIWPYEARRELRRALSEFFLDTAYYYQQIIRAYCAPKEDVGAAPPPLLTNERTPLLQSGPIVKDTPALQAMEEELQRKLLCVSTLLESTRHEPRLKGLFPVPAYRAILSSCHSILSSLTAIARMISREQWLAQVRRDFVVPVSRERREMVGNVTLFLSLLSSSVILKTSLPAYLPPAKEARQRLLSRLRDLEVVKQRQLRNGTRSLIYYAYVIMMGDIIRELEELGRSLQALYGVVGGSAIADFEALFAQV